MDMERVRLVQHLREVNGKLVRIFIRVCKNDEDITREFLIKERNLLFKKYSDITLKKINGSVTFPKDLENDFTSIINRIDELLSSLGRRMDESLVCIQESNMSNFYILCDEKLREYLIEKYMDVISSLRSNDKEKFLVEYSYLNMLYTETIKRKIKIRPMDISSEHARIDLETMGFYFTSKMMDDEYINNISTNMPEYNYCKFFLKQISDILYEDVNKYLKKKDNKVQELTYGDHIVAFLVGSSLCILLSKTMNVI